MSPFEKDVIERLDRIETLLKGDPPTDDFKVGIDPRDWSGASYKDRKFSECPPSFLLLTAAMYEAFARGSEKENKLMSNGKPKADFDRKLASTARAWAKHTKAKDAPVKSVQAELEDVFPDDF